jgi:hypothetical protein
VVVAGEIAEKRVEGRDAPGVTSVRDIVQSGGSEEAVNDSEVDLTEGTDSLLPAKQPERADIAGVGGAGVVGEAALGSQMVKVALKQGLERMLQVGDDVQSEKRWDSIRHAGVLGALHRSPQPVEFAQFAARLGLFTTFLDAWFFVVLAAFEFALHAVYLQFLFQLTDGIF